METLSKRMYGQRLYELRIASGMTQLYLSECLGWCPAIYCNAENGRYEPSIYRFWVLADVFDVSLDYLLYHLDNPPEPSLYRWYPGSLEELNEYVLRTTKQFKETRIKIMSKKSRMADLRKQKHYTQEDMAKRLGISTSNYGRYEIGIREPDIKTLSSIADVLDVSIDFLVGRCDTPYYEKLIPTAPVKQVIEQTSSPAAPAMTVQFPWMPKTEEEFRAYILGLMKEKSNA